MLMLIRIQQNIKERDRPRFFDQVGHQTTNASIGNEHFVTKYCHRQTYQNYEQSWQKLGTFLENKILRNLSFQKISPIKVDLLVKYSSQKKNQTDSFDF